jgi:hypothetical protein
LFKSRHALWYNVSREVFCCQTLGFSTDRFGLEVEDFRLIVVDRSDYDGVAELVLRDVFRSIKGFVGVLAGVVEIRHRSK